MSFFAAAIAARAGCRARAGGGATAIAVIADFQPLKLDLFLNAEDRFDEINGDIDAPVASAACRATAPRLLLAKGAVENVEDVLKAAETARATGEAAARAVDAGMAETVVARPLLVIGKHFVGFVDFFELFFGVGFLADVGVVLARQPAKGALDLARIRALRNTEHLVIISWHGNNPVALSVSCALL